MTYIGIGQGERTNLEKYKLFKNADSNKIVGPNGSFWPRVVSAPSRFGRESFWPWSFRPDRVLTLDVYTQYTFSVTCTM